MPWRAIAWVGMPTRSRPSKITAPRRGGGRPLMRYRVVEEQQARIGREPDPDVEMSLLAMRELIREQTSLVLEADDLEHLFGARRHRAQTPGRLPEVEARAPRLRREADVFEDREIQ